ncbi:MAG: squalene--hopene cyclase [Planctomycetota bacterium]
MNPLSLRSPEILSPLPRAVPGAAGHLDSAIDRARRELLDLQEADGHWLFELEADCTIPAEYLLMMHFLDEIEEDLQDKFAVHLRRDQAEHGGWALYHGGCFNLSTTVKAYWALKLAGDDPGEAHMVRARKAILEHGGAEHSNVFTRFSLAMFGEIPWRGVPFTPVEILFLPRWFPFHLSKISYWSRTVMVPLSILYSLKAKARNPRNVRIQELFVTPPEKVRDYFPIRSRMNRFFLCMERSARRLEPVFPGFLRRMAIRRAENWFLERMNGVHGLGGIFPAMVNAYEALALLGYPAGHPHRVLGRKALRKLVVENEDHAWCQPCFSPVWDTALAALALGEVQRAAPDVRTKKALDGAHQWLVERQVCDGPADWRASRPHLRPGGWAFQYRNPWYPDLDDTSAVAWSLHRSGPKDYDEPLDRAADWLCGMQSRNGGFASFDADNTAEYLNEIPFADHGALLDPPTADVTGRCITLLARMGRPQDRPTLEKALDYIYREQEPEGPWYGRWGTNYIYGTWSVLSALEEVSDPRKKPRVRRAVDWLTRVQRPDGSWGEDNDTYAHPEKAGRGSRGTSFQTAWALLGLLAAGEGDSPSVRRGIQYLLDTQKKDGLWEDESYTAPGFPRVFYLRYHGYQKYFPLWALARYRRMLEETAP